MYAAHANPYYLTMSESRRSEPTSERRKRNDAMNADQAKFPSTHDADQCDPTPPRSHPSERRDERRPKANPFHHDAQINAIFDTSSTPSEMAAMKLQTQAISNP